jgi:hypothetical protein
MDLGKHVHRQNSRSPERRSSPRSKTKMIESTKKATPELTEEDLGSLSPAQIRELGRRVRDRRDSIRYMLVSEFSRRFILYYNVSDDVYVMNDPTGGTLFKRLKTAKDVKRLLSEGTSIVKYTTKGGKLKRLSRYRGIWTSKTRKRLTNG